MEFEVRRMMMMMIDDWIYHASSLALESSSSSSREKNDQINHDLEVVHYQSAAPSANQRFSESC